MTDKFEYEPTKDDIRNELNEPVEDDRAEQPGGRTKMDDAIENLPDDVKVVVQASLNVMNGRISPDVIAVFSSLARTLSGEAGQVSYVQSNHYGGQWTIQRDKTRAELEDEAVDRTYSSRYWEAKVAWDKAQDAKKAKSIKELEEALKPVNS